MIATKIENSKKSSSKAERAGGLADYIRSPEHKNGLEKCIHSEAVNFLTETPEAQKLEMISLSQEAIRSKDPIDHWVLSWKHNERPTVDEVREAVSIFIEHCGLTEHQYIWGLHDDTENMHVHIAINRVHPDTVKVIKINKGFDKEASQQAIAIIEKKQGWSIETKARYRTNDKAELIIDPQTKRPQIFAPGEKSKEPTGHAKRMEIQTGEKSAQRIGTENAPAIIASATSWADLHTKMQAAGMEYQRQGSGAAIKVGDTVVKASDVVDRKNNFGALQKRLGIYQPFNQNEHKNDPHNRTKLFDNPIRNPYEQDSEPTGFGTFHTMREMPGGDLDAADNQESKKSFTKFANLLQPYESPRYQGNIGVRRGGHRHSHEGRASGERQPLKTNQLGWNEYTQIRDAQRIAKSTATIELQKRHAAEKDGLKEKQKADRSAIFGVSFKGRGAERNEKQSVLATQQAAELLELAERHKAERKALQACFKPLPMYKEWKDQPQIVGEVLQQKNIDQPPKLSKILKALTHVADARGHITYSQDGKSIFRDEGRTIQVLDLNSDEATAAALATAQQKFGNILTLTGSPEFQKNAVRIAVENNLTCKFLDPELEKLRGDLQAEKYAAERAAERTPQPSPPSNKNREAAAPHAPAPEAQQPKTTPVDPGPQTLDPAPKAQDANARLKKAVEFAAAEAAKVAQAEELQKLADAEKAEAGQLSEIHELAQAAQGLTPQSELVFGNADEPFGGKILALNEKFIAIQSGREKKVQIYDLGELLKNWIYDGIAEGDELAPGNTIERKNGNDGMRTLVTETRPEMQTQAERDRRSGQGQGG